MNEEKERILKIITEKELWIGQEDSEDSGVDYADEYNTTQEKDHGYHYSGTKEDIAATASSLQEHGTTLVSQGWYDISHSKQGAAGFHAYEDPSTGLKIRFDEAKPGEKGYAITSRILTPPVAKICSWIKTAKYTIITEEE